MVDAFRAVALLQKAVGKVSPRLAPDLGVVVAVPVTRSTFRVLYLPLARRTSSPFSSSTYFFFGFRKPLALLVHRAHRQEDMGVGIAAACVVDIEVGAHSFGNKLRGTVFTDKP